MWEPGRLTTLWVSTAWYGDSFTFVAVLKAVYDREINLEHCDWIILNTMTFVHLHSLSDEQDASSTASGSQIKPTYGEKPSFVPCNYVLLSGWCIRDLSNAEWTHCEARTPHKHFPYNRRIRTSAAVAGCVLKGRNLNIFWVTAQCNPSKVNWCFGRTFLPSSGWKNKPNKIPAWRQAASRDCRLCKGTLGPGVLRQCTG
jgi:hypothetical protein